MSTLNRIGLVCFLMSIWILVAFSLPNSTHKEFGAALSILLMAVGGGLTIPPHEDSQQ